MRVDVQEVMREWAVEAHVGALRGDHVVERGLEEVVVGVAL